MLFRSPIIDIEGYAEVKATAHAYVSQGKITKIVIDNPGKGYLKTPIVKIIGSENAQGEFAVANAILGNGLTRSIDVDIKFDRTSRKKETSNLHITDIFVGELGKTVYNLSWPANEKRANYSVFVNNEEKLLSEVEIYNVKDTSLGYERYLGKLKFSAADIIPAGSSIVVNYERLIDVLNAVDRVEYFYNSAEGQAGKDLTQLMTGMEYSGVNITGTGFDNTLGWDAAPWYSSAWDALAESFDTSLSGGQFNV